MPEQHLDRVGLRDAERRTRRCRRRTQPALSPAARAQHVRGTQRPTGHVCRRRVLRLGEVREGEAQAARRQPLQPMRHQPRALPLHSTAAVDGLPLSSVAALRPPPRPRPRPRPRCWPRLGEQRLPRRLEQRHPLTRCGAPHGRAHRGETLLAQRCVWRTPLRLGGGCALTHEQRPRRIRRPRRLRRPRRPCRLRRLPGVGRAQVPRPASPSGPSGPSGRLALVRSAARRRRGLVVCVRQERELAGRHPGLEHPPRHGCLRRAQPTLVAQQHVAHPRAELLPHPLVHHPVVAIAESGADAHHRRALVAAPERCLLGCSLWHGPCVVHSCQASLMLRLGVDAFLA